MAFDLNVFICISYSFTFSNSYELLAQLSAMFPLMVVDCNISKTEPQLTHCVMYNLLILQPNIVLHKYTKVPFEKLEERVKKVISLVTVAVV